MKLLVCKNLRIDGSYFNEMVSLILQEKGTQLEGSEICAIATMCVLSPLRDWWNWANTWNHRILKLESPLKINWIRHASAGWIEHKVTPEKRRNDKYFLSETTQTLMYEFEFSIRLWFTSHWGTSLHFLILPNQSDVTIFLLINLFFDLGVVIVSPACLIMISCTAWFLFLIVNQKKFPAFLMITFPLNRKSYPRIHRSNRPFEV